MMNQPWSAEGKLIRIQGFKFMDHEPVSGTILQKELKFELPNLRKRYMALSHSFDHIANYHTLIHL